MIRLGPSARALLLGLAMLLGLAPAAIAHTRSETHSNWRVAGSTIQLTFTIPELEARRLAPHGAAAPTAQVLGDYVATHVFAKAGGQPCHATPARTVEAAPGMRRFELTFTCPGDKDLEVGSTAFFDLVATHTNFAQIETADGRFVEQLITKDTPSLSLTAASGGELQNASFLKYVAMGVMHIVTGPDHQSFLLGLVLLSRRLKDLTFVITGFTLGHSLTLALAVTGLLRPHAEYIDALVGLTIALVGAECLAETTRKPWIAAAGMGGLMAAMALARLADVGLLPPLLLAGGGLFAASYLIFAGKIGDAARMRLVITVVFGLIHGFGFAADLLEARLPKARLAELLVGFNLGVELAQLCLVLGVTAIAMALVRVRLHLPRHLVADLGSAFLIGLGLFWFVARSYA